MLAYALCYAASLPLVNSVIFAQVGKVIADPSQQDAAVGKIFFWNPCAWIVVGWLLTGWRQWRGVGEGRDCLIVSALLSAVLGLWCLWLPATPPARSTEAMASAVSMLKDASFLAFLLISLAVFGAVQFCFMGFARFLDDVGVPSKNVPAALTIAPVTQAFATAVLMSFVFNKIGFRWTLALGAGCWLLLFLIYMGNAPRWLVVVAQSLHALGCMFFIIVGQIYAGKVAPPEIANSVQALVFMATVGFGFFCGSQAAGVVMDRFTVAGKFQWRRIWAVPCAVVLAAVVALSLGNLKEPQDQAPTAAKDRVSYGWAGDATPPPCALAETNP
jgi:predicted MFS family arabinose efflux permease